MMKTILKLYFNSWWLPALLLLVLLACVTAIAIQNWQLPHILSNGLFYITGLALLGVVVAAIWNLINKRWARGIINILLGFVCGAATLFVYVFLMIEVIFETSEDRFADNLTIPEGIDIAEPDEYEWHYWIVDTATGIDEFQQIVRNALAVKGGKKIVFTPHIPSLRRASTEHTQTFLDYLDASPDWHVFFNQGNRFASRRWSYGGEPRNRLHGYISDFGGESNFQTRCLLCLDRKQWSRYSVQHVEEGTTPVKPDMSRGNNLRESRVMIDCGGVWVEIFEQSDKPERRVTKATMIALEKEFSKFLTDPQSALAQARARSRELAGRLADQDDHPFRLRTGMQPGMYGVVYSLNPGEPGSVYLRAYEVTQGTPLSVGRLKSASKTRMAWSTETLERFDARAEFTIYEGVWGKPYAARFEVWFKPDSGEAERKLAERIFKIEGWQR